MPQKRNQPAQKGAESFASSPPPPPSLLFPARGARGRGEEEQRQQWRPPLSPSARFSDAGASFDKLARTMEGYSRDLLCGIGRGDAPPRVQRPGPTPAPAPAPAPAQALAEMEEVELSLGLSLGGRFGVDRKDGKLVRSSSVAAVMTAPVELAPAAALGRTSSLPVQAEASEVGVKQGLDGWGSCCETGGLAVEPAARLRASLSPSSGSSDGEGQRLQDTLIRSSSLPAGIEAASTEEWQKRKAAQSLKRLELKKRRVERRNSLTCNSSKEAGGQILEEMKAHTEKIIGCDEAVGRHNENQSLMKGLPPKHQITSTSHDSFSVVRRKPNSTTKGTATVQEHSPSSGGSPPGEAMSSATVASPLSSSSSSASRAATLGSRGDQQGTSSTAAARARSMGDVERTMMREMPSVFTKGLPNGNRVEGFLYKYRKGEEVRIVCICHGSFHTPAEFVEHAGGRVVANPLRHIVVNPLENL